MFRSLIKLFEKDQEAKNKDFIGGELVVITDLLNFYVVTPKGIIGQVADFGIEEQTDRAEFVIINTKELFSEENLLVRTEFIKRIDFEKMYLYLSKTIDEIRT